MKVGLDWFAHNTSQRAELHGILFLKKLRNYWIFSSILQKKRSSRVAYRPSRLITRSKIKPMLR